MPQIFQCISAAYDLSKIFGWNFILSLHDWIVHEDLRRQSQLAKNLTSLNEKGWYIFPCIYLLVHWKKLNYLPKIFT